MSDFRIAPSLLMAVRSLMIWGNRGGCSVGYEV